MSSDHLRPHTAEEIPSILQSAIAQKQPLEIIGRGSRREFGLPVAASTILDLSHLSGIVDYEPEELILTVRPGTLLSDLERLLIQHRQHLAFEPPDFGPLWGRAAHQGTIGGSVNIGLGGSRRLQCGAPRDHLLGFSAVAGHGVPFKAGGKVVKNVTGYDLPKLMCGAFGTLAILTELTFKVLPAPETTRTLLIEGLTPLEATEAMTLALNSPWEVSGAAHLAPAVTGCSALHDIKNSPRSITALRLEGVTPSVIARAKNLCDQIRHFGEVVILEQETSIPLWREICNASYFAGSPIKTALWRLALPSGQSAHLLSALPEIETYMMDWGGGLIWLSVPAEQNAGADKIRSTVARYGGIATLLRASVDIRHKVSPFPPQPEALATLTARVKEAFDPHGILNPGRMMPLTVKT